MGNWGYLTSISRVYGPLLTTGRGQLCRYFFVLNLTKTWLTMSGTRFFCIARMMSSGQISSRPHTTDFPQKVAFRKGNPLISGKSRLVKYYSRCGSNWQAVPVLPPGWYRLDHGNMGGEIQFGVGRF